MIRWSLIGSAAVALSACGPDGVPVTISGFAATGAAMANANVTAKCVSGPQLTGTTDANGLFVLTLNNQTAPCIVRVTSGGVTLHSFADSSGRLNITPLTELSVGKALGADPATAFASFDGTKASTIANGLAAAKASIKTQVEALTGASIAGDLFTSTFRVGDPDDLVLDSLNNKLAAIGRPLSELVAAAAANKPLAPRVKVFGDSLSDSGTFGLKFTVQGTAATGAGSADIWVDLVAKQLQTARLCPYFSSTGSTFASRGECTNYAIGGGRVNYASNPADPRSIPLQLKTAAGIHGSYTADDVLLIVGGGNDAADLAGAYLAAGTNPQAFQALLASVLGQQATEVFLAGGANGAMLATLSYMENVAVNLANAIREHALSKGASRVVLMNMPDIALTPRFGAVLYGVTQQAGAQQAADVKNLIQTWVNTFNQKLASEFANNTNVAVLDFNTTFRAQVASPATFGFTNGTDTACPPTGTDSSGLPTYTFPTCTATALSGQRPDWQTYMFSDGFHPTPLAHSKAADLAVQLIRDRGWN
jgi:phospholipase/lecithinase/hemolysin